MNKFKFSWVSELQDSPDVSLISHFCAHVQN